MNWISTGTCGPFNVKTVYSDSHELHDGLIELDGDKQQPGSECPARAVNVLQAVIDRKLGDVMGGIIISFPLPHED